MKHLTIALIAALLAVSTSARNYHIIPQPKEIIDREGQFVLRHGMKIYAQGESNRKIARFFADKLNCSTGLGFELTTTKSEAQILLLINKTIRGEEAYRLSIDTKRVVAEASTDRGLFYSMQTFLQMLPPQVEAPMVNGQCSSSLLSPSGSPLPASTEGGGDAPRRGATGGFNVQWSAPAAVVNDEPRFEYRGFMLDPCRHFFTVDEIKKQIDIMAMYKANNMHFHLTEDQGWRVEIKKYPRLTEVGATAIGRPTTADGSTGPSRYYYTQDELRDLVAYAQERFINIIPEFEMPGHELAAISAYPWLSCRSEQVKPRSVWGVEPIIMCAGKESTFQFLQDVVDELVDIFPSKYFHIGGDEAPRDEWKTCPLCQHRADSLGFTNKQGQSREAQLQSYIVSRMEQYLNRYGRTIIGWDEILEGGNLNQSAIVMSWRGTRGGVQAAKAGHKAIMAPSSEGCYLDYYEGERVLEPVAPTYAANVPLSRTYDYEPIAPELEGDYEQYILGPQGNLWSEYIPDLSTLEFRFYPRILAIMETGWSQRSKKDFADFCRRLDTDSYLRIDAHRANYNIPVPEQLGGSCNFVAFTDQAELAFQTTRPEPMYYTLDGTQPTLQSQPYTDPIILTADATVKIATILPCGLKSPVRTVEVRKQTLAPALNADLARPQSGLLLHKADGIYSSTAMLAANTEWEDTAIPSLESIPHMQPYGYYAAEAEGFVNVPQDGVWYFRSNYPEVWIDETRVVDNTSQWVLDGNHGGRSMALAKGLHRIKVTYLGYNASGRPTWWDSGQILWRCGNIGQYEKIKPEQLVMP